MAMSIILVLWTEEKRGEQNFPEADHNSKKKTLVEALLSDG